MDGPWIVRTVRGAQRPLEGRVHDGVALRRQDEGVAAVGVAVVGDVLGHVHHVQVHAHQANQLTPFLKETLKEEKIKRKKTM